MQVFHDDCTGTEGGPPSIEAYKRAVYKQPPRTFAVEVLLPQKHGNAYSYGMLISPIRDSHDRHSIVSRTSDNSSGSSTSGHGSRATSTIASALETSTTAPLTTDYEVWRRWEDCLYFQDLLEVQYTRMSREKRNRLQAGKGVKKNGLYAHEDPNRRLHRAASFESLPPGPDPKMIAKDVHDVLPRLMKKGTLFKASKETIEQRGQEFKALIEALLREGDDVPSLIMDLRQLREVRDFFGFWRRDQDRVEKQQHAKEESDRRTLRGRSESLGSRASGIFSSSGGRGMYFSASHLSLQLPSQSTVPEPSSKQKGKQVAIQAVKVASISGGNFESDSSRDVATPRRRAQTLQGVNYGVGSSRTGLPSSSSGSAYQSYLSRPPATAPAGMSFAAAMESGYSSDTASASGSPTSTYTHRSPPASPSSLRMAHSSQTRSENFHGDAIVSDRIGSKGKGVEEDEGGAIIVSLEEGETLPFDAYEFFTPREHGHLLPHKTIGGVHRLQDMTIKEEDEREIDDEHDGSHYDYPHSDYQLSESSVGHGTRQESLESDDELRTPASPRIRSLTGQSFTRFGSFFRPSSSADSDAASIADVPSLHITERPKSPTWSTRSQTPVSSAYIAAAHADALRALTGGRSMSPPRHLAPPDASARSSVLTITTSGSGSGSGSGSTSGSTNSGHARSSDTQSSIEERPHSYQSSIASCLDLDRHLTSSPGMLHSPLFEGSDGGDGHSIDQRQGVSGSQRYTHDSMCSVQTFMSESSVDMFIPPREQHHLVRPRHAPVSRGQGADGGSMMRSFTTDATSPARMSQLSTASESMKTEDGEDFLDQYFGGAGSPDGLEGRIEHSLSPGVENLNGSFLRSDTTAKPYVGSSGHYQRPMSPALPVSARNSVMTVESSVSVPSSISPSIVPSMSEESSMNAVPVKVVYGEHIVAFRIDRSSPLADVREKMRRKLADQQNVTLPDHFALAYKPPGPGRVQELRATAFAKLGRARSSSVSSVGSTDPGSLRILFTQRDWLDAVGTCPSGSKVTLHVLNRP